MAGTRPSIICGHLLGRVFATNGLTLMVSMLGPATVAPLTAQVVQVQTVDTVTRTVAPSTVVSLLRAGSDQVLVRILTDAQGRGTVTVNEPGTYRLRVDRIGYATTLTAPFTVGALTETLIQRIAVNPERFLLPELDVVVGEVACGTGGVAGPELAVVWEEARKTLTVTRLTAESVRPLLERWRWERTLTVRGRWQGEGIDQVQYIRDAPFVTVSPKRLRESGFADVGRDQALFYLPDAAVLLDEAFLETHCFRLDTEERRGEGLLGLRFMPLPDRTVPDIEGVLWIRRSEAALQEITFQYVNLPAELQAHRPGGTVSLAPIANGGGWIVDEWYVQTPVLGVVRDGSFTGRRSPDRRGGALVAWHLSGGKARAVPSRAREEGDASAPGTPGVCGPTPTSGGGLGVVVVQVVEEGRPLAAVAEAPVVVTVGDSARQTVRVGDGRGLRVERPAVRVEGTSDGDGLAAFCGIPVGTRLAVQAGKPESQATVAEVKGSLTEIQVRVPVKGVVAAAPRRSPLLRGRVVDTAGAGLGAVEVALAEAGRRTVTDEVGRYEVRDVPPGRYQVVFRRIGYQPLTLFRSFLRDTVVVEAQLAAEAFVLPELETKARGPEEVPVKLREWARRREFNGGGKFWDDSLLRTLEYRKLADLLQPVSGVRLFRFRGGLYLVTAGGRAGTTGSAQPNIPDFPKQCYAQVYLDGARLSTPADLNDIPVNQIMAMEFYRTASEMPVELNTIGSMCGVLAVWTRVGGDR